MELEKDLNNTSRSSRQNRITKERLATSQKAKKGSQQSGNRVGRGPAEVTVGGEKTGQPKKKIKEKKVENGPWDSVRPILKGRKGHAGQMDTEKRKTRADWG